MNERKSAGKNRQSKAKLQSALAAAWSRVAHDMGKAAFIEALDIDLSTYERAIKGPSLPSAENLLNSLDVDPTALAEVLTLYGLRVAPAVANPINDFELASHLGHTLAELIERLRDGHRCHVDTAVLAALFRQVIPQMQAIVNEDDKRKVGA